MKISNDDGYSNSDASTGIIMDDYDSFVEPKMVYNPALRKYVPDFSPESEIIKRDIHENTTTQVIVFTVILFLIFIVFLVLIRFNV